MKIPPTLTSGREPNNNNNKPYVSPKSTNLFADPHGQAKTQS